jgi:hypothetical protein
LKQQQQILDVFKQQQLTLILSLEKGQIILQVSEQKQIILIRRQQTLGTLETAQLAF